MSEKPRMQVWYRYALDAIDGAAWRQGLSMALVGRQQSGRFPHISLDGPATGFPRTGFPRTGSPRTGSPRTGFPRTGFPRMGLPVSPISGLIVGFGPRSSQIGIDAIPWFRQRFPRIRIAVWYHLDFAREAPRQVCGGWPASDGFSAPTDGLRLGLLELGCDVVVDRSQDLAQCCQRLVRDAPSFDREIAPLGAFSI
jgi:hypothetical protein